jgi:putative peptidoglycan lipid II flippase
VIRSELSLAALAVLNIAATLLNQLVVFTIVGPGASTDALVASATIPTLITTVWSAAIPAVLVPLWTGEPVQRQVDEAFTAMVGVGALTLLAVCVFVVPAHWWIALLFRGFTTEVAAVCVDLFRIQMAAAVMTSMWLVVVALTAARARFIAVEFLTLALALVALVALFYLLPLYGVAAAAWINLVRSACLLLSCLPLLGRWPNFQLDWAAMRRSWGSMRLSIAANAYYKTEVLVDRHLLSMASAGDLSLYGVAQLVNGAASSVLGKAWGTTVVTPLIAEAKAGNRRNFFTLYWRNLRLLLAVSVGGALAIGLLGPWLLDSFVQVGQIETEHVRRLWVFFLLLSGTLVGGSAGVLLAGGFYAVGDVATPAYLGCVTFTIFAMIKYLVFIEYGVIGLCLVSSAYYLVNAGALMALFLRAGQRKFANATD